MTSPHPEITFPDGRHVAIKHLTLDFTGTLSKDGELLPGVADRIRKLADLLSITVLTADTFGKAAKSLEGLPLAVRVIKDGRDKRAFIESLGGECVAHIGNGRNDVEAVHVAAIGIAVVGPEGAAGGLVRAADIITRDITEALDLISHPLRMKATLRD